MRAQVEKLTILTAQVPGYRVQMLGTLLYSLELSRAMINLNDVETDGVKAIEKLIDKVRNGAPLALLEVVDVACDSAVQKDIDRLEQHKKNS